MKAKIFTLFFVVLAVITFAQTPTKKPEATPTKSEIPDNSVYKLFPTKNMWTFLKLDTRNGLIWQVQFDVSGSNRGQTVLNSTPIVTKEGELKGRFTLYPTENIYNFLLLDQIGGFVFQVQWSMDEKNRAVIPIF